MFWKNKAVFMDWKFYFKLVFGLFFTAVLLYGWLDPLINGIIVSDAQKADAINWAWFPQDKGDFTLNYLSFFTIQTNILVALWLILAAIFWEEEGTITSKWFGQYMALAITTFIAITGIVFNTMLLPTIKLQGFFQWFTNVVQHMICPVIMIVYFLFIMPREKGSVLTFKPFCQKYLWRYYLYPIVWAVVMLIRGEFRWQAGKVWAYQYFFMNIHKKSFGLPGAVWLLIATIFIILIVFAISSLFNYITYKQLEKAKI